MQTRKHPYGYVKKYKVDSSLPAVQPVRRRGRPRTIIPSKPRADEKMERKNSSEEVFKSLGIPGKYLNLFKADPLEIYNNTLKKRRIGKRSNKCKYKNNIHSKLD
jgi:hypothetical protein